MILPLCYCTEYDQPHVHLPPMRDGQYGLSIEVDEPPEPTPPPSHIFDTREGRCSCGEKGCDGTGGGR